jgi:hypothetical protein
MGHEETKVIASEARLVKHQLRTPDPMLRASSVA